MVKKIIIGIFYLVVHFFCFSHNFTIHDDLFKRVLFGSNIQLDWKEKEQERITLLCYSSRVAIDQYNGRYELELDYLKSKGIKTISSLRSIDFTSNSHHQRYTHRGWTFSYVSDLGNWAVRRQLMLDTTSKVFSFSSVEQQDAFAALMYYVHILGDHSGDKIATAMDRIALGGRSDKFDILNELSDIYLPRLFKNQEQKINILCVKLQAINRKCANLLRRKGDGFDDRNVKRDVKDLTEQEYGIYQEYANETLRVLINDIHQLLKNETWFLKKFPSVQD